MLASTVQFSTNNQPTTHSPTPATQEHNPTHHGQNRLSQHGMQDQAMPGRTETTTTPTRGTDTKAGTVVPSGPNRVPTAVNQPHQQPVPHHPPQEAAVLRPPAVAGHRLASVSAYEHPTTQTGQRGPLNDFRRQVAP